MLGVLSLTYDHELTLVGVTTYTTNAMGDSIPTPNKRVVLASLISYRNKEFDQAMANGLKPEKTFAINECEYDGEKEVEFDGKTYAVVDVSPVRTKNESEFEAIALICSGLVNGAM